MGAMVRRRLDVREVVRKDPVLVVALVLAALSCAAVRGCARGHASGGGPAGGDHAAATSDSAGASTRDIFRAA